MKDGEPQSKQDSMNKMIQQVKPDFNATQDSW
jgi:hypothetical protein